MGGMEAHTEAAAARPHPPAVHGVQLQSHLGGLGSAALHLHSGQRGSKNGSDEAVEPATEPATA